MDDDDSGGEYSPVFYLMLAIGFVGIIGFLCTGGALVGGM